MKPTKEDIQKAIGQIDTTIESIAHQEKCIEGELDLEDVDEEPSDLRLSDMWDCNDLDNWTSMDANLQEVKDLLVKLLPHV
jgi:hypothetical protein